MPEAQKIEDFNFTVPVRGAYANIIEAKAFKKGGKEKGDPKYSIVSIVEPDNVDFARLKKEVTAMLQAKNVSGKKLKIGRLTAEEEEAGSHIEVQVPWKNGTVVADKSQGKNEIFRGKFLIKASSKYQPALSAVVNKKLLEFTTPETILQAKKYFYSGAWFLPGVGLHWYKGDEGKPDGVSLYLNALMFTKDDTRIGGRAANAATAFAGYLGSIKDEDPTGGAGVASDEDELEGL